MSTRLGELGLDIRSEPDEAPRSPKGLLMVAYHYPPEGGSSGVLRTLKFSRYLPAEGWTPHVLTLRSSFYPVSDESLLGQIPREARVHRTFALDTARHLAVGGRYLAFMSVPDRFVSWLPFGVAVGLRAIRRHGLRALYSTCPPPTAHLIGLALKRLTGLPWAADFRDPWIEDGIHPRPGTFRYRLESRMERRVVCAADRLTVTTPRLRRDFLSRYPQLAAEAIEVIYNGYDESDSADFDGSRVAERFEILHAGLLTAEFRDPFPILEVVAKLVVEGALPRDRVRVTLLGGGSWVKSAEFTGRLRGLGLEGMVYVVDRVPHVEALRRMREAAVLLLLQASDDTRSLIPAKAFEYLRIGRPILALTPEGATVDLLSGMEGCRVIQPGDHPGLRRAVLDFYHLWWRRGRDVRFVRPIEHFERRRLTGELARLLDQMVDVASHRAGGR